MLYEKYSELLQFNPNLILYGPPGTGKTYATKKIVESFEMNFNDGKYKSFSEIEREKRVKFVTFHQAYSYEEFIEGIRPQLESDESNKNDSSEISYIIQDGIIKQLANSASMQYIKQSEVQNSGIEMLSEASRIWKVSLGRKDERNIYKDCKDNKEIAIGWLKERSLEGKTHDDIYNLLLNKRDETEEKPKHDAHCIDSFVNEMSTGDIVFILNSHETIRDIGIITSDYYYNASKLNLYPHRRKVKWLKEYDTAINIYSYNGNTRLTSKTIYELSRIDFSDLKSLLEIEDLEIEAVNDNINQTPYYLIIDEINRGNIAKIFGELITLIEKDKREELSITLPYSKKSFKLPSNIYIIGTMNTADRSIAILDTALRRRFTFAEIEPDIKVFNLPNENGVINDTIDLPKLLTKLNGKIIDMLDRDHRIGHSYFMGLLNLKDFHNTWYYKIIPLLMEYFYNDLSAIKEIIGSSFLKEHGGIEFLSMESKTGNISEFEESIISIYTEQNR
ncbi:AAA family ATPase [Natronospora cellulosivora (SeqCode)]